MPESTMKGFEFLGSSDASDLPKRRRSSRILVEGYDTSLHEYDLKLALRKHFSSCGEIIHIYVPRNFEKGILQRFTFIDIAGEGAQEKALQLSGSDVGGWRVFAKACPDQHEREYIDPGWAAVGIEHFSSKRQMLVTGYDTSLPEIDIQIGLSKHFSSCGEVTRITIPRDERDGVGSNALIYILGEGAVDKALELSGRDVGGWNIKVVMVLPPLGKKRNRPSICRSLPKKASKMTMK